MKSLLLVGGLLGWGLGMSASFMQGHSWPVALWHGGLAAYVAALLMRWWGRAWRKGLEESLHEREEAAQTILPTGNIPKVSRT